MQTIRKQYNWFNRYGWSVLVLLITLGLFFVVFVEMINILFFDPYAEEYFLFRLGESLIDIDIATLTWLMILSLLFLLLLGLPLVFVTGGLGVVFIYLVGGAPMINLIPSRIFPLMTNSDISAIPLFIFMAAVLERAGIIEELFDIIYQWLGGLRGGLAAATIIASTLLAAMVGVIGAAVVTMGLVALPIMLKKQYDKNIALGSIMAGGTLGILIPPSILAILYAAVAQESVGELYLGAIIPGLILSLFYTIYILIKAWLNPQAGPALAKEERLGFWTKIKLLARLILPIGLIAMVLGFIFTGIATPVEAAGIGSFGAMIVALLHRRFNLLMLKEAAITTVKASAMVLWVIFGASVFVGFYILQGGQDFVSDVLLGTGLSSYEILFVMMGILIVLGMFLDWVGILLLAVPIFMPIIQTLEFNGLFGLPGVESSQVAIWFGVLYLVNMQMSFLSPPFGYALFYLKGVCPPEIKILQIFRASLEFLFIQAIVLALCIVFPALITWLPNTIYK